MKKKPDLKPGDVFWFYNVIGERSERKFVKWNDDFAICDGGIRLHYLVIQGIRRKKRKPEVKAREFWIHEAEIKEKGLNAVGSWRDWFESPYGEFFRTTPPANPEGWMHVIEQIGDKK